MKLTEHFTIEEMQTSNTATRMGLDNTCPPELHQNMLHVAEQLEIVRAHYRKPLRVLSCYRAPEVNTAVGGSKTSAHRFAMAADFIIPGVPVVEVARWCAENLIDFDQVICEFGAWVHLGFTRKTPRRQELTATKQGGKTVYTTGLPSHKGA